MCLLSVDTLSTDSVTCAPCDSGMCALAVGCVLRRFDASQKPGFSLGRATGRRAAGAAQGG
eukprot:3628109-Prymnesium_polylepis.1